MDGGERGHARRELPIRKRGQRREGEREKKKEAGQARTSWMAVSVGMLLVSWR